MQVEQIARQLTRVGVGVARGAQRGRQGDGAAEGVVRRRHAVAPGHATCLVFDSVPHVRH